MRKLRRHRLLHAWARFVTRRPRWVLGVAIAIAIGCIAITIGSLSFVNIPKLQFQSDRNKLLSKDLAWNQHFINWNKTFRGTRDLTLVIDSNPGETVPDADQMRRARALADELGYSLAQLDDVEQIMWRFDGHKVPRAMRMLDGPEFAHYLNQFHRSVPLLESPSLDQLFAAEQLMKHAPQPGSTPNEQLVPARVIAEWTALLDAIDRTLREPESKQLAETFVGPNWQYLTSDNNRLLYMLITPRREADVINEMGKAIASIREIIEQTTPKYDRIEAGLTGTEVVEADETEAVTRDSIRASVLAVVLIGLLLVSTLHGWRAPLMAVLSLLIAVTWSFGYLTLTIGHLQVISVVFTVILLGLGIDFGIHILTRYELISQRSGDDPESIARAISASMFTAGPGILTGALTTAAAFMTTMFTDFQGVAEMGHIAAAGIVLCVVVMFSVFPALLSSVKSRPSPVPSTPRCRFHVFCESRVMSFANRPKTTVLVAGALTLLSVWTMRQVNFDYDLMALLPEGVDSVRWQQRVNQAGGRTTWYGVSIGDDFATLRRRIAMLRTKSKIDPNFGGVGRLFPPDEAEKIEMIGEVRARLGTALDTALANGSPSHRDESRGTGAMNLSARLTALKPLLSLAVTQTLESSTRTAFVALDKKIEQVIETINGLRDSERESRLRALQSHYADARSRLAHLIDRALDPSALAIEDFPEVFRHRYVGSDGSLAMEVYPRLPIDDQTVVNALSPSFLPGFVKQLKSVDPEATGVIVQIFESGHLILRSYLQAGVWAVLVVYILLCLDFRSLLDPLCCLVPVMVGFSVTFAVMYLIGAHVNPANIIVLPLMFGIGVDSGVHILHRFRQDPTTPPLGLTAGTGKGITITSLTTMIGFGTLTLASHRGIRSLGWVLACGIGLTMLACWIVMPALLALRTPDRTGQMSGPPSQDPDEPPIGGYH